MVDAFKGYDHNVTCSRRFQFCCGHRVYLHESKCKNIHGHNYVMIITASAVQLDKLNRVIDFSVIKEEIGQWIDTHWDHGMLLWEKDPLIEFWECLGVKAGSNTREIHKYFVMPCNPTAEGMAQYMLNTVTPGLFETYDIEITKVEIWETENCKATATR